MESSIDAYHNVNSNHNIYAISPVLLFGCERNVGPKFQIILNCIIKRKPSKKNLCNTTGQVLKETPSFNYTCPSVHKFIGLEN